MAHGLEQARRFALVLPGEAMWGPFQTGFAVEMGEILRAAGWGDSPYALAVGSSSGSLVAAVAAAGVPFNHELARRSWIEFGQATRLIGRLGNPYPAAMAAIFDRGLIDTDRAFASSTDLVLTASHYDRAAMARFRRLGLSFAASAVGLRYLVAGSAEEPPDLTRQAAAVVEAGTQIFAPRYFTKRPWTGPRAHPAEEWIQVSSPQELRRAIEASSRIPFLYGDPISQGADVLVDGVYASNAPVAKALEFGATDVFVVTSSRHGNVFDRPIQGLLARQTLRLLRGVSRTAAVIELLPGGHRLAAALSEADAVARIIPRPRPVDLAELGDRHPGKRIYVVHPEDPPPLSRFLESRPAVLGQVYDMGKEAAVRLGRKLFPPTH